MNKGYVAKIRGISKYLHFTYGHFLLVELGDFDDGDYLDTFRGVL